MFDALVSKYIGALIRAALQGVAGALVAAGAVKPEMVEPFVSSTSAILISVAVFAVSLLWSFAEKKSKTIFLGR